MITVTPDTRIQVRNILLATDFSASSEAALPHALALARRYDACLYVAHVIRPDLFDIMPSDELLSARQRARRHAEGEMSRMMVSGRLRGIAHQVLIEEGPLWSTLSEVIESHDVDLAVVGSHGRTGSRKLLLGSVAEEIFRLAQCPVLTVGPHAAANRPAESVKRVIYATDFRPHSERAAAYALSLAQENEAVLTLLHIVKDAVVNSPCNAGILRDFFVRRMKALVPSGAEAWCQVEYAVEFGEPAAEILRMAEEHGAELIVLGIRRSATFAGHLPPATAYKVVCQARCPVLTVRG